MPTKSLLLGFALISVLTLSSCYRVPVPQGNKLPEGRVQKIVPGMTSAQVIKLLGSPVINNTFANGQITYVYTYKFRTQPLLLERFIVYLQNDRVVSAAFEKPTHH